MKAIFSIFSGVVVGLVFFLVTENKDLAVAVAVLTTLMFSFHL